MQHSGWPVTAKSLVTSDPFRSYDDPPGPEVGGTWGQSSSEQELEVTHRHRLGALVASSEITVSSHGRPQHSQRFQVPLLNTTWTLKEEISQGLQGSSHLPCQERGVGADGTLGTMLLKATFPPVLAWAPGQGNRLWTLILFSTTRSRQS